MRKALDFTRLSRVRAAKGWAEESVDLELRHHIEMRTDELIEEGLAPDEARRVAEESFGQVERYRAECVALQRREVMRMTWMDRLHGFARDVALAARGLRRSPGFTVALLATLGLGVGANTAIFAVVDAVLVRPLPYGDADRLFDIAPYDEESGFRLTEMYKASALAWRDDADFLDEVGLWTRETLVWTAEGREARRVSAHLVTPELMSMLGIEAFVGRSIVASDGAPGAEPVVLLSEDRWSADFGRDPSVIGRTMTLQGREYTVIGVMPRSFRFPISATRDLWATLGADDLDGMAEQDRIGVVGKLPAGADTTVVTERAEAFQAALAETGIELSGFPSARLTRLDAWRANRDMERTLWIVMAGSVIILLITGMNAANLLLVRSSSREAEIGIRLALGGARGRVVRQLSAEALITGVLAAGLAVLVSAVTLEGVLAMAPREVTTWSPTPVHLSGRVALFTVGLAAAVSIVFGIVPLSMSVGSVGSSPLAPGVRTTDARRLRRWRSTLVVGEVALSVVLMVGAGVFVRSFVNLVTTDPGFEARGLVTVMPGLLETRYPTESERAAFFSQAKDQLAALPGVESVTLSSGTPPQSGVTFGDSMMAEGLPVPIGQPDVFAFASVDPAFLATYRAPLVAGRNFGPQDTPESRARIIDLEMARWLFGEEAPIGKRFRMGEDGEWQTVVGVVRDLHLNGFDDAVGPYDILRPLPSDAGDTYLSLTVRTSGDPSLLAGQVRDVVRSIDPNQPIYEVSVLEDEMVAALESEQFLLRLLSVFAAIALGLSALGTFGVVAFVVRRRYREIGVRVALGAARVDVHRLVMRQGVLLALWGVTIGVMLAVALGRYAESLLTDVSSTDPLVMVLAVSSAFVVTLVATALPARWATRVDPMRVLSAE